MAHSISNPVNAAFQISDKELESAANRQQTFNPFGFGLRSASRESGAEGGEERLANHSRSATPAAEPQKEARRFAADSGCQLVTSARICEVERASSKGNRATGSPWNEANRALVTAAERRNELFVIIVIPPQ